jgi:uncharacterized protein (DUF58 family)
MDRHELLAKITSLPLTARGLAEDLLSGGYRSVFKGQGIEFDEVRRYETGDDIRSIDWNVSARFGTPYLKVYREEREMTVCLILDNSASMHSTPGSLSRWEQGVIAAALIAFSAVQAGQRVSAVFFDREIRAIFPPRKGRAHAMAIISAALEARPGERGSGLGSALIGAGRFLKRRSLAVIVSDFLCVGWEQEIGRLARKHDVIALGITSPLDREIPGGGLLTLEDPETGVRIRAPTSFPSFRGAWASWHEERRRLWEAICRRSGTARMELSTAEDAPAALLRYFRGRRQSGGPETRGGPY